MPNYKMTLDSLLTFMVLFVSLFLFMTTIDLSYVFNSDQLNLSYMYNDFSKHHGTLAAWTLSSTHYLFPDALILFFYSLIFAHFKINLFLTTATMLVFYYACMVGLATLVSGVKNKNIFRFFALLSLVLASGSLRSQEIFFPVVVSHFGSNVIIYLLELYLMVRYILCAQSRYLFFMFILLFLTNLSDPLTMVVVVGSAVCAVFGLYLVADLKQKECCKKIIKTLFIATFFSILAVKIHLFHLHVKNPPIQLSLPWQTAPVLYHAFLLYWQKNAIVMIALLVYLVVTLVFFFELLFFQAKANCLKKLDMQTLFVLLSLGSTVFILVVFSIMFDRDLNQETFYGLRHFNAAILLPVFLGLPILLVNYTSLGKLFARYYFLAAIVLLVYMMVVEKPKLAIPFLTYQSPVAECLDRYAMQGQLGSKNGVADYWDAHLYALLSRSELNIVAVLPDYRPYRWMSTDNDYQNKTFSFVILRQSSDDILKRTDQLSRLGKPRHVLTCAENKDYLIYVFEPGFVLPKTKYFI